MPAGMKEAAAWLREQMIAKVRPALLMIFAAASSVLLLACFNLGTCSPPGVSSGGSSRQHESERKPEQNRFVHLVSGAMGVPNALAIIGVESRT
jgi:hypothetical protein